MNCLAGIEGGAGADIFVDPCQIGFQLLKGRKRDAAGFVVDLGGGFMEVAVANFVTSEDEVLDRREPDTFKEGCLGDESLRVGKITGDGSRSHHHRRSQSATGTEDPYAEASLRRSEVGRLLVFLCGQGRKSSRAGCLRPQ